MSQSSIDEAISTTELAYYSHRLQARMFDALVAAFADEVNAGRTSRAALAKRINASPSQITRWFSHPSNLQLSTIGALLLGMGAELDPVVTFIRDRADSNYAHPLIDALESIMPPTASQNIGQVITLGEVSHPETPSSSKETDIADLWLQA